MKYGFIGCGNMGSALIRAAVKAVDPSRIMITDTDEKKAEALAQETGTAFTDLKTLAEETQMIFLGVKPQMMEALFKNLQPLLDKRQDRFVLVSMAAGLSIEGIRDLGHVYPVIRIMPNLAASVNEGMILWAEDGANEEETEDFKQLMKYAGKLLEVPEEKIDAGSAISGCGPAYVYLFLEALADAGVSLGLTRDQALLLASQTVIGAAKLQQETGKHPGELKDAVCSPGGTTIAGVLALEKGAFRSTVSDAVLAAFKRTRELG